MTLNLDSSSAALLARSREAKRRWKESLRNARAVQRQLLTSYLEANANTVFGREHGFAAIRDTNEYRRAVPPRTYEELAPWIERAAAGEPSVLTSEPPVMFNRTSGSTSAAKMIPVLDTYDRGVVTERHLVSLATVLEHHPEILDDPSSTLSFMFTQIAKPSGTTSGGLPIGAVSARSMRRPNPMLEGWPGRYQTAWGQAPAQVQTLEELNYFRARGAVEHDVRCMLSINPSTLVVFAQQLHAFVPRMAAELRAGTVLGQSCRPPNPARADELEAMCAARGPLRPVDLWPNLSVIWTWKAGSCSLYLPAVEDAFGSHVDIMPWPTLSSEVSMTVPIDHADDAPLAVPMAFFEFLAVDEAPGPSSRTLLCEELTVGQEYQLIVTQACGLYRYITDDVVRVTGWEDEAPRLVFLRRRGSTSSFTGEKLTERHVEQALRSLMDHLHMRLVAATCYPVWAEPPYYTLCIEPEQQLGSDHSIAIGEMFDAQMCAVNEEYASKRASARLGEARAHVLRAGTFARQRQLRVDNGESQTQMKDRLLQKDDAGLEALLLLSSDFPSP